MKIIIEEEKYLLFYYNTTDKLFLKTYYDEHYQILFLAWFGSVSIDTILNAYVELGNYHKKQQFRILRALVDLTYLEGSFEPHNDWMLKDYWHKAMRYGYYRTAFIKSKDYFSNLSLALLTEENNKWLAGHEIKIFDNVEDAEAWLKSE
jgi:hypothetical protein